MSDLDSFFAKKDKKKLKGKKFNTTDEIAKRLETTERKVEKNILSTVKSESVNKVPEVVVETTNPEEIPVVATDELTPVLEQPTAVTEPEVQPKEAKVEEEQWNDFKDDEILDVSNLKITKLNIEEEEEGRGGNGEGGEEGKENSGEEKKDGVWKIEEQKSIQSTICEAVDAGLDEMQEVKATVAAMSANQRWNSQLAKELQPSLLPRGAGAPGARRKKTAPDITNDMAFPTLADAKAVGSRKKRDEIRENENRGSGAGMGGGGGSMRGMASSRDQSGSAGGAYKPPMLRTNNRFGALTDHSSLMRNS